ncbi:hypothetical protein CEUSTIGMA_g3728.t1 [Chlamydomonas eustigma]|uniref:Uncharacterized protein n=1 Tax=Chlamydomonas eustigma TaxID=1157962 RepID=A0A250WZL2_9CHLO|nr:hypothetical protein CEUSTIGMA_g3728.t1 [Chlamydomonas eustigma]|eukprot:GAX76283.1 hypothetical protein CEUSTIGMA_g3728.t1 [Chlamydomonas eustigma]
MNIAQETYGEVFALELLVQQMFVSCQDPEYRALMAMSVRQYMIEEVYNPSDSESPFTCGGAYMNILGLLVAMQNQGVPVTGMVDACKQLADAQSRRAAVAAQILPVLHWVFLHGMEVIFVACFLIFDASNIDASVWSAPLTVPVERSLIFGALFGVLALNTLVLKDLDYPVSGLYAFRGSLDDRVSFLTSLLAELEKKPPDHVPSSVMALKQLGLISSPSAATDNGVSASPLDVPELARRARGRKMRTVPGLKWGQKVERW